MGRSFSDAVAVGRPALRLSDEDREAIAELLADLLISQLALDTEAPRDRTK